MTNHLDYVSFKVMDTDIIRKFLARFGEDDAILTTKKELGNFMLEVLEEKQKKNHSKKLLKEKINGKTDSI